MISRNSLFCLTLVLSWAAIPSLAVAQNTDVCVVDVALIFKKHPVFNQQLEGLKQEAEQLAIQMQGRAEALQRQAERLKQMEPGTEYAQLEQQLAGEGANLEVDRRAKTREFVRREAKLHFDTYVEVTRIISVYCEERGIRLALRYTSDEMKQDEPETIMQRVNNNIVYWAPHKDITQEIIQRIAQTAPQVSGPPAPESRR